jgi:predicted GNAT family acetyltransferase
VAITVGFSDDPGFVLAVAGQFLASRPVAHNLILSLLHARRAQPEPGRYWLVARGGRPIGVVFQSPTDFLATITPMPDDALEAAASSIADAGVGLPGVNGEAGSTARFAGAWTEFQRGAARPFSGQRIYELRHPVEPVDGPPGVFRPAAGCHRELILSWIRGFREDTGEQGGLSDAVIDRRLAAGQLWLWEHDGAASMAAHTDPVQGVVRIQAVYTPSERRRRGYAGACVSALSTRVLDAGHRCILYAELSNPVSNSVYRRIGYQAVAECLTYRFA